MKQIKDAEKLKDLYWCFVCKKLVSKDHRDEQWCDVNRIPAEAVKQIIDSLAVEVPKDSKRCPDCGDATGHPYDHVILEHDGEQFHIVDGMKYKSGALDALFEIVGYAQDRMSGELKKRFEEISGPARVEFAQLQASNQQLMEKDIERDAKMKNLKGALRTLAIMLPLNNSGKCIILEKHVTTCPYTDCVDCKTAYALAHPTEE